MCIDGMIAHPAGPSLDRSGEPWVGVFPSLGTVRVHADGSIDVDVESNAAETPESFDLREAALRFGWGEPLSLVRQGYRCASGSGLVPPDGRGCLVLHGPVPGVAIVLVELVGVGWSVLSDRLVPTTQNNGTLLGHPRAAPVLTSRRGAIRADLDGVEIRAHTDAVAVDVPRAHGPTPVRAFVEVGARRPHEAAFEELTGHERFAVASRVMVGGVMAGDDKQTADTAPDEVMRRHLELTALRFGRLRIDSATLGADVAALCRWWSEMTSSGAEASQ